MIKMQNKPIWEILALLFALIMVVSCATTSIAGDNHSLCSTPNLLNYAIKLTLPPEEEWNRAFGGTDDDRAYSVQQTANVGYVLAGCTASYCAEPCDFWLVKTDSAGNEEWSRMFVR